MPDYLYISYPVACSLVLLAITSVVLNLRTLLCSACPSVFVDDSLQEAHAAPRRLPKHHRLQPAQWSSETTFSLERRAILSHKWICVSHLARFTKPGDYITLEFSGFKLFIIMGKDNTIRTFHNVCRHRAFPITRKAAGSATLLGCRYHGWSYDTKGQLTKAPQFDQLPGFDKSANGLFEVNTKTDTQGFIYMNLNSNKEANSATVIPPEKLGRPLKIRPSSKFLRSWEIHGKFNWKSYLLDRAQDGAMDIMSSHDLHFTGTLNHELVTTIYTDHKSSIWIQVMFSPSSADETTVRCDAFVSNPADAERFKESLELKLDHYLNDNIGMHEKNHQNVMEQGRAPVEFPRLFEIFDAVDAHYEKERAANAEINPAAIQQCRSAAFTKAEGICKAMDSVSGKLDW